MTTKFTNHPLVPLCQHVVTLDELSSIRPLINRKAGVYVLINTINGKYYIGSSVTLGDRLADYTQPGYHAEKANIPIVRAIVKYGLSSFLVGTLEICDKDNVRDREQYFIDTHKPHYNVLTLVSSSLGLKHTEEVKDILRKLRTGAVQSPEVRSKISLASAGENNGFYGRKHSEESKAKQRAATLAKGALAMRESVTVEVEDLNLQQVIRYTSLSKAAKALGCTRKVLDSHVGKVYRDRYIITIFRTPKSPFVVHLKEI